MVKGLEQALYRLRDVVGMAEEALRSRGGDSIELSERVNSYRSIVEKQISLLPALEVSISQGDRVEAVTAANKINSLSQFIIQDAEEIMGYRKPEFLQ